MVLTPSRRHGRRTTFGDLLVDTTSVAVAGEAAQMAGEHLLEPVVVHGDVSVGASAPSDRAQRRTLRSAACGQPDARCAGLRPAAVAPR
jgi:hypothetical protein